VFFFLKYCVSKLPEEWSPVGSDQVSSSTTTLHGVTFQKTVFVFTAAITCHYKYKIILKNKNQLDATYYFIVLLIGSTCFGHYYAHHQELATIVLITTLVVSFCKDGGGSVNVKLWFLVVCVRCEVLCRFDVAGNVFLLILIVVIIYVWWS